jgi:hypothetical protein
MVHYRPVRALRLVVVTLLVAAGFAIGAPSAYADDNARLGLSPNHGSPDAPFTATLRWQAVKHGKTRQCAPDQITFEWDGSVLGSAPSVPAGDSCIATLSATPPAGTYQGVSAHVISVSGARGVRVRYTVVPGPAAARGTSRAPSAASPEATPDSTETATAEAETNSPAAPAAAATAKPAAGEQRPDSGLTGLTGLIVAFGTVLFLAGAGTFGLIAWRARRARSETGTQADTEPLLDVTRPLPIPRQAGSQEDSQPVQLPPPGN